MKRSAMDFESFLSFSESVRILHRALSSALCVGAPREKGGTFLGRTTSALKEKGSERSIETDGKRGTFSARGGRKNFHHFLLPRFSFAILVIILMFSPFSSSCFFFPAFSPTLRPRSEGNFSFFTAALPLLLLCVLCHVPDRKAEH